MGKRGRVRYAGRDATWRAGLNEGEYVRVDGRRMYRSRKSAPIFRTTFAQAGLGSDSYDIRPSRRRCNPSLQILVTSAAGRLDFDDTQSLTSAGAVQIEWSHHCGRVG